MKRPILLSALPLMLFAVAARAAAEPPAAVIESEARRIDVMSKAKDAVVAIFPANGRGGGSGVVISPDGYALTNYHVVLPCGEYMQCGMADGKAYDAVLVGLDPTGDVSLIKLFGRDDFPCAELADSDKVRAGDWVFAAGNPFLLATDFQPTVTFGIISGVHRYQEPSGTLLEYTDCLQSDASVNPGNSGGPLFDDRGRVIGINGRCSFEKRGRVNVGVAYAISSNQIKNFMGALRGGRLVDHATLGASVKRDPDGHVTVDRIIEDSDAYRRGLRQGDEVVSFGGRSIATVNEFKNVLGIFPKGWRVPLSFRREAKRYDILVRLAGVHGEEELLQLTGGAKKPEPKPTPKPDGEPKKLAPGKEAKPPAKAAAPAALPIPKIVTEHYKQKRGFSNYFFNDREQKRVWNAWNSQSKLDGARGTWIIGGPLSSGGQYSLKIGDAAATLKLPTTEINWTAGDDLGKSLLPEHTGGLLPAIFLWRRLALEGLDRFGDLYYYGTAPLAGRSEPVDVLVGLHKGVECRFYFDPADGRMLAMEMFPNDESDPCEIYFSDYRQMDGRLLPGKMEVRFGDETAATLKVGHFGTDK